MTTNEKQLMPAIMESVLLAGDLGKLTAEQRMEFYGTVCDTLRLNPLTKPFEYIMLNGKLTLYATKNCTDQLRARDGISLKIADRQVVDGIYVVTAAASTPAGRVDESTGAVPVETLKGEARANAYMKAETKAKRRATLSLCGLGLLDESEVDSIPGGRRVAVDESGLIEGQGQGPQLKVEAGGIDTGGHAVGTQAAADYVAQEKIRQMKEKIQAPRVEADKPNSGDYNAMLEAFGRVKQKIGAPAYYRILREHGYEKADEITDVGKGRDIFVQMKEYEKSRQGNEELGGAA